MSKYLDLGIYIINFESINNNILSESVNQQWPIYFPVSLVYFPTEISWTNHIESAKLDKIEDYYLFSKN